MHIGLETAALKGEGFIVHADEGRQVKAGEPLISFDLDILAHKAASLAIPILLTNGSSFTLVNTHTHCELAQGDPLFEIVPAQPRASFSTATDKKIHSYGNDT